MAPGVKKHKKPKRGNMEEILGRIIETGSNLSHESSCNSDKILSTISVHFHFFKHSNTNVALPEMAKTSSGGGYISIALNKVGKG